MTDISSSTLPAIDPKLPASGEEIVVVTKASTPWELDTLRYRISFEDDSRAVTIVDRVSGERYVVWLNGLLSGANDTPLQFWGRTTLILEDGTKLTFRTRAPESGEHPTIDSIVVTFENYGARVSDFSDAGGGVLTVVERPNRGRLFDVSVRDGNVIFANQDGEGFVALDQWGHLQPVDQAWLDATDDTMSSNVLSAFRALLGRTASIASVTFVGSYHYSLMESGSTPTSEESRSVRVTLSAPAAAFDPATLADDELLATRTESARLETD